MDSRRKYDQVVRRSASQFIQGILAEDPNEADNYLAQSRDGLLRALNLRGAAVEVNGQQFLRGSILERVGDEILCEVRRQLFQFVFPRIDGNLKLEIVDAFEAMQKRFRELALPVLH
jgi:hypothetical protein